MIRNKILIVIFLLFFFVSPSAVAENNPPCDEAQLIFQENPSKVLEEISTYIDSGSYWMAKTRAEAFLSTGDAGVIRLYQKAIVKLSEAGDKDFEIKPIPESREKITCVLSPVQKTEMEKGKQDQEARQIEHGSYELVEQALDQCKHEIAKFLQADGSSQIPDVQNFGSGNEFLFGWGRGKFQITTAFGTVDMSASCDGSLKPLKVISMSINGKTIILGGKPYL
jgi:hypothetical protein